MNTLHTQYIIFLIYIKITKRLIKMGRGMYQKEKDRGSIILHYNYMY